MKAELVPEDGGPPIPVTRDVTVVGRREYCDIQLDHPSLSKRHAVLVKTDGLLILRDLISTNGTKVKGQRIRWAALLPDDRISLGALKFTVYLGPDNVPAPSERAPVKKIKPANGRPEVLAAAFASPSPLGVPVLPAADNGTDSDDWRRAMNQGKPPASRSRSKNAPIPLQTNDDDLILEEEDDDIIELE